MTHKKYASIRIRPIVYEKNTNGEYELDTNYNKIILVEPQNVTSEMDYDVIIEIKENVF